jgi:hypothetical protein
MVQAYDPADPDQFLCGIFQGRGAKAKVSARHWWHYNAGSLEALLGGLGYTGVTRCEYRQGACPDLDRIETRPWSLFMEGFRPGG